MARDVQVAIRPREVEQLKALPELGLVIQAESAPLVAAAQASAPRATGKGAESIHTEAVLDGDEWEGRISWTRDAYYMRFHELGTRTLPARPFLVPAVKGAAR